MPVMRAAVEGRGDSSLQLLAVTVLTSFDRQDLAELGYDCEVSSLVNLLAPRAMQAGMDGVVASPLEAASVRTLIGSHAILVTPGVRRPEPVRAIRSGWPLRPKLSAPARVMWSLAARLSGRRIRAEKWPVSSKKFPPTRGLHRRRGPG